ncbi:MAG: hypothetical protein LBP22_00915 [Deltaproteobacteria bacterium]|jgi:hypothetical protein|nr:hypothetical protein [Deltaproteobacteria bacterium]
MANLEDTLRSLARRILALDEDELVRLIPKYRKRMDNFTPSQEWEESVIIYFIINGFRVKSAQFSEELKGYMSRKDKDRDRQPVTIKPDIRKVPGRQPSKADQKSKDKPAASPAKDSPEPKKPERPALRLIKPKKDT